MVGDKGTRGRAWSEGGDVGGGSETECGRLDVGGVGLGHKNDGHKFLARLEAAGIAASKSQGEILKRDSAGEELTMRVRGRGDSTDSRSVDEGGVMSAMYSGFRPQVALALEVGMAMGKAEGLVAWKMMRGMQVCHLGQGKSTRPVEMVHSTEMA